MSTNWLWNWEFPIWEIIATLLITGTVTWFTIHVSIRQARRETLRILDDARKREVLSSIPEITQFAEAQRLRQNSELVLLRPRMTAAISIIRASGIPYCREVAKWIEEIIGYAQTAYSRAPNSEWATVEGTGLLETGATHVIETRISEWLEDPETAGPKLAEIAEKLHSANTANARG